MAARRGSSFREVYSGGEAPFFRTNSGESRRSSRQEDPVSFELSAAVDHGRSAALRAGADPREVSAADQEESPAAPKRQLNLMSASFTLANTILGIGLLGLPAVAAAMGMGLFLLIILWTCILAMFTAHLMVQSSQVASERAFVAIGEAAFGKCGAYLASGIMVLQTSCTLTAYIVLIKTMGVELVWDDPDNQLATTLIVVGMVLVLLLPMSLLRDLSGLSFSCYFAVSVFITVVATVVVSTQWRTDPWGLSYLPDRERFLVLERPLRWWGSKGGFAEVLTRLPSLIFAFVCHHTVLPIYADLEDASPAKMNKVTVNAFGSALVLYVICGVAGYYAFRDLTVDYTKEKILDCFPDQSWGFRLERCAMLIAVLFGFPCVHFGSRKAMTFLIFGPDGEFTWARHCGVTCFIVGYTTVLALVVPNLTFAFMWAGATVSPTMMYLYPAVTYLAVFKRLPKDRWTTLRYFGAIFILFWCILVMSVCIWSNLQPKKAGPTTDDDDYVHWHNS